MLEQKPFEKGTIIAIRISTGDEILGQIENFDSSSVTLNKPCSLAVQEKGISLVPATMMGDPDKPVKYERSSIIATMVPNEQFLSIYEQHIGTIVTPVKQSIVVSK